MAPLLNQNYRFTRCFWSLFGRIFTFFHKMPYISLYQYPRARRHISGTACPIELKFSGIAHLGVLSVQNKYIIISAYFENFLIGLKFCHLGRKLPKIAEIVEKNTKNAIKWPNFTLLTWNFNSIPKIDISNISQNFKSIGEFFAEIWRTRPYVARARPYFGQKLTDFRFIFFLT